MRARLARVTALLATALAAGVLSTALVALTGRAGTPPATPAAPSPAPGARIAWTRLLAIRAPDPSGGPPWGIRLLGTTEGWTCAQVGRVVDGRFGELGLDGAFADDGRLHAPPSWQIPAEASAGTGPINDVCLAPGETFAGEIQALDRSAAFGAGERSVPRGDLRRISFGLLGPHVVAISYAQAHGNLTIRPVRPLGAYLVVGPVGSTDADGIAAALGSDRPGRTRGAGATATLRWILYRFAGRDCREVRGGHACPSVHGHGA